jgi:hypothetical protein
MWTQPQLSQTCYQVDFASVTSVPLNRRTALYHVEALPSSRSTHCRIKLQRHAPSSTSSLIRKRFVSFSRCLATSVARRRATETPHFSGAVSALAQDQFPDHGGWIVIDDLQSANLQLRCHASPFGRDNCRLFAGSTANYTALLSVRSRSRTSLFQPRRAGVQSISAAGRIARRIPNVKGSLRSIIRPPIPPHSTSDESPVYSPPDLRIASQPRSFSPNEPGYWHYLLSPSGRQSR